jgi:hypothetical protein
MVSTPSMALTSTAARAGGAQGTAGPEPYRGQLPRSGVDYFGIATGGGLYGRPAVRRGGGGGGPRFSVANGCRGSARSGAGALAQGWCLMDLDRPLEATKAFDRAIAGGPGRIREEAAYGKSLAYLRKGLTDEAALAAAESPQNVRRSVQLGAQILTQRALAFYKDKRYVETIVALDERSRLAPEQVDLMAVRGFSYYELGRYDEAEQLFRAIQRTGISNDGARGLDAVRSRQGFWPSGG